MGPCQTFEGLAESPGLDKPEKREDVREQREDAVIEIPDLSTAALALQKRSESGLPLAVSPNSGHRQNDVGGNPILGMILVRRRGMVRESCLWHRYLRSKLL